MKTIRMVHGVHCLVMAGLVCAVSVSAEGGRPPTEVVPEAGEIDAGTVQAGDRVMVVHGRGERHPVSGEWARLDTSAGWVQAVDVSALVLAREGDLRQERIPLDRIQRRSWQGCLQGKRRSAVLGPPGERK